MTGADAAFDIVRVRVAETRPLRAHVLRSGAPPEAAILPGEDHPDVATFAAHDSDGQVIGCAVLLPETCPSMPSYSDAAWRLRGMATAAAWRGQGIGTRVLAAVLEHVAARGGGLVWCNARTPARRLYERAGFCATGERWDDPEIGPHVRMWCEVPGIRR